ncbi:MAG: hypothetical protein KKE16_05905 [Firmicutes bacterium]|nr:hypothetical protein [Bacillota bacterium]
MRQHKKPIKFYITIFIGTSIIIMGYSIYLFVAQDAQLADLVSLWILPLIFTLLYYGGDSLVQKIADRKKKVDYEGIFLRTIGERMSESKEFLIEDFRKLQRSEKFQSQVHNAYLISQNGESELMTLDKIQKKFRPDTVEWRAMLYVCSFVKEKLEEKQN